MAQYFWILLGVLCATQSFRNRIPVVYEFNLDTTAEERWKDISQDYANQTVFAMDYMVNMMPDGIYQSLIDVAKQVVMLFKFKLLCSIANLRNENLGCHKKKITCIVL